MAMNSDETKAIHRRVVAAAALAPSAENTQPWYFRSIGGQLLLYLDLSRTLASDIDSMLAYTGLGACLENAVIASRECGYEPDVQVAGTAKLFPETNLFGPIATLSFHDRGHADVLHAQLSARCTCRRLEPRRPVDGAFLGQLSESAERFAAVRIDWVTEDRAMRQLGALVGKGNRIRLEYKPFHAELYDQLRLTPDEAKTTRDGLDVATLQLPAPVASVLKLLRTWPAMRLANWIGFSRSVASQAAREVAESSAIGLLSVDSDSVPDLIAGGRAMERLWLTATSLGLAFHPTAALGVFLRYAPEEHQHRLLPRHAQLARDMRNEFSEAFPQLSERTLQMAFRIGYGERPKVRSLRRPVESLVEM